MAVLIRIFIFTPRHWWRSAGRGCLAALLAAAFIGAIGLNQATAQTVSREYQIKTVFLYNFVQFTEWPTNAFATTNAPLIIGVLGADPFGKLLEETVRGERKQGRKIEVRRYRRVEDATECHALFISSSETNELPRILAALQNRAILTVGEGDGFAQHGGIVRFVTENNKVRFNINLKAAKAANVTISSKLLRLADITGNGKD